MLKFDLQLFAAVQGKDIVYLFRVLENAASDVGAVIAYTTENENSASADGDSTVTKDGVLQKPGAPEVEITGTCIVLQGDETQGELLREAMLEQKTIECWEADLSNPRTGTNKYAGRYYQGLFSEFTKTSDAEELAEYSWTFKANGVGVADGGAGVTVTADQQAAATYAFTDTTAGGA